MKKLSLSQIAGMSCMIFAIFFGAGNMIFPLPWDNRREPMHQSLC